MVPVDGEPKGCKWAHDAECECDRIICDLAGARAQVHYYPQSIPPERLRLFRERIVLPPEQWNFYDGTGWIEDLQPVLSLLQKPDWPLRGRSRTVPAGITVSSVDQQLRSFFQRQTVSAAILCVRSTLMDSQVIRGEAADELVWRIEAYLGSEDFDAVIPAILREQA